jgi:Probable cobalt transporter subunit (CbtA)
VEKRFVLRGFAAGAFAGLLAFVFARIMAEPVIQAAIDYESGRDAANDMLRRAAGLAEAAAGPDIYSRGIQRTIGIATGLILFGLAMGGLVAVVHVIADRRSKGCIRPRVLALLVAGAGFLGLYLVPYLKYPANPPSIGHAGTIQARGFLYLGMVAISIVSLLVAVIVARRLEERLGTWNATLAAGLGFVAWIAVVMVALPPLGHLHSNLVDFGNYATETPQPLKNADGVIVYPGFPADVLFKFRLYSVINQLILWTTLGLGFGALAERLPATGRGRARAASLSSATRPEAAQP